MAIIMATVQEVTRSVKALGVRDWLLVVFALYVMGVSYVTQRSTHTTLLAHAAEAEKNFGILRDNTAEIKKLVLLQFTDCISKANEKTEARRRCEDAMEGIRSWR